MSTKNEIINLLRKTKREGIEDLIDYMIENGFFHAPCSGQHHLAEEGGLAEHSLNVYIYSKITAKPLGYKNEESLTIASLLHDIGKIGAHGKPNYVPNILKSGELSKSKPYETNKDLLYVDHAIRSVAIISRFIELTEEEEHAILYHNGKYTHIGYDLKETELQMLIHFADLWVSRAVENIVEVEL